MRLQDLRSAQGDNPPASYQVLPAFWGYSRNGLPATPGKLGTFRPGCYLSSDPRIRNKFPCSSAKNGFPGEIPLITGAALPNVGNGPGLSTRITRKGEATMLMRTIGAGLTLTALALTTGCCHHKQTCCAPPAVSRAPCCPPPGTASATAVPVP